MKRREGKDHLSNGGMPWRMCGFYSEVGHDSKGRTGCWHENLFSPHFHWCEDFHAVQKSVTHSTVKVNGPE